MRGGRGVEGAAPHPRVRQFETGHPLGEVGCRLPRRAWAWAAEADPAGAGELSDAVRTDELLERVELLGPADDLERERVVADVGDARAEDVAERDHLRALLWRGGHGDQRQLSLDRLARRELRHAEDVHELVHLLLDLLERVLAAV